jgi:outer membrane autotransporter protein
MAPKDIGRKPRLRAETKVLTVGAGLLVASLPLQAVQLEDFGDTELQTQTGKYIDTICPQMAAIEDQLNDDELRLLNRCGGAKFDQEGEGFTEGDTPGVLQRLSPEETLTVGSGRTDTALKADIDSRLDAVRAGISGVTISGVQWDGDSGMTGGTAGADDFKRWGFFLNGVYATGDKDTRRNENGFDYDAYGLTTGIDYRFSDQWVGGVAYGYVDTDADIDDDQGAVSSSQPRAGEGKQESESHTLAFYGTWYSDNFYADGALSFSTIDIEGERSIQYGEVNQTAKMDTDADQWAASIGGGYNHHWGGPWNARYFGRIDYVDVEIDGYSEKARQTSASGSNPSDPSEDLDSLIMSIGDQDIESLQSVLGAAVTYVANQDWGVLTPYLTAQWHHEFEDDSRVITAKYVFDPTNDVLRFTSNDPDEDFFRISLGLNSVLKGGTQVFINYDTVAGLRDVDHHAFTAGFRIEF